jgi:hypothetical protein
MSGLWGSGGMLLGCVGLMEMVGVVMGCIVVTFGWLMNPVKDLGDPVRQGCGQNRPDTSAIACIGV